MPPGRQSESRQPRTSFDVAYAGTPSWETGRPQPVVCRLLDAGSIDGAVLDAGCGTGTHAVLLARAGHRVAGVDLAPAAVGRARTRAAEAAVTSATFAVGDAMDLARLAAAIGAPFDTVLDVGLLHVLQPAERRAYARALAAVTRPGGRAFIVCWSDRNPFGVGPARVTRRELRTSFRAVEGWRVDAIGPETLESNLGSGLVHAWLARLTRRPGPSRVRLRGSPPVQAPVLEPPDPLPSRSVEPPP
jgi:SAM-dependent methyltransferase